MICSRQSIIYKLGGRLVVVDNAYGFGAVFDYFTGDFVTDYPDYLDLIDSLEVAGKSIVPYIEKTFRFPWGEIYRECC